MSSGLNDEELVNALCEVDSGLSGRELDFIESLADRQESAAARSVAFTLTERQRTWAEDILARVDGRKSS